MIKYVFFDFNGTILDDVDLCLNLLNQILTKQNKKTLTKSEYKNIFTFPIKKYYELAGIDFNLDSFEDLSDWFIANYQEASFKEKSYPNLVETIIFLKEKGIKIIVLSASQLDNLKEQLTKLNLIDKFDYVLGLDNIYAASKVEVGRNFIIKNNINPKEVLLVGDTTHDFEVSQALGFNSILFTKGHQSIEVLEKTKRPLINDLKQIINYLD